MLSPNLFNFYLNDLIIKLEKIAVKVYAFADDLVMLCKNINNTKKIIKVMEKWGESFELKLNKKKCGIMFYNEHRI